jgi:hypothetical protein
MSSFHSLGIVANSAPWGVFIDGPGKMPGPLSSQRGAIAIDLFWLSSLAARTYPLVSVLAIAVGVFLFLILLTAALILFARALSGQSYRND